LTDFIIEHQCPQCGAPAELEETDRLFRCGFCRVTSYLTTQGVFRYVIPHNAPEGQELIYVPYWRFKGMLFWCLTKGIENRFADVSQQALPSIHFPNTVGFRSQTQKLGYASGEISCRFLQPQTSTTSFLTSVEERFSHRLKKPILHHAQIGETLSLLYAPFYLKDKVIDAVTNTSLEYGNVGDIEPILEKTQSPVRPINFVPTLCPQCGWDLEGQRDALVLACSNCKTLWRAKQDKLQALKAAHAPSKDEDCMYMPFWRIQADISPIQLRTRADLVKVANLPQVPQPGWEQEPFYFWSPAFKVRPQVLLTYATNITVNQQFDRLVPGPPQGRLLGVNMPFQEAVQGLKLLMAGLMRPKERMVETIADMEISARRFLLVYIPFREGHHEYIHDGIRLAINKNLLAHARNL
jgi:predicted RNA-binding Zn-ribbon protein involved in translation (DUF1610 family)